MIEKILGTDSPTENWAGADRRVKPALQTLLVNQAALMDVDHSESAAVDHSIRSGFPDLRRLIEWYQRAAVRTVGEIAEDWEPFDCIGDSTLRSCMIDTDDDAKKRRYRLIVESTVVKPACNRGYRRLRSSAVEYVKAADQESRVTEHNLDPYSQASVAMRPGFQTLDDQQRRALDSLWGGFDDEYALADWLHSLNSPSNGEIADDIEPMTITDENALKHLVYESETSKATAFQAMFAASLVLPAFVDAVRSIETQELAKETKTGAGTMQMKGSNE